MTRPSLPDEDALPAWEPQRDALRRLHHEVMDERIPPELAAAAELAARRHARNLRLQQWSRWGGIAAGLLIVFVAGWLANAQWSALSPKSVMARKPSAGEFVHAAAVAHAVYVPEKRHPVEVAAAEQQHLVQWLSRRLDKPLKVPDLSADGYKLVGGRLLPGDVGARAQLMFEDSEGKRVTLYLGSIGGSSVPVEKTESAFRFSDDGPVPSFYWVDQGFGYALAGRLSRETLMRLATSVHGQL